VSGLLQQQSGLQEFFMGSVSNQVIQIGVEQAVWVVT